MKIYMLNFGLSGIKNIEKYIELSFYKKQVNRSFDPSDYRVKAIYGENGSGKTAIVTAVDLFRNLIIDGSYLGTNQRKLSELVNKKSGKVRFYAEFYVDFSNTGKTVDVGEEAGNTKEPVIYSYELELGKGQDGLYCLTHELLRSRSATYPQSAFKKREEVVNGQLVFLSAGETVKGKIERQTMNLLDQQTFVATLFRKASASRDEFDDPILADVLCLIICALEIDTCLEQGDNHDLYFFKTSVKRLLASDNARENKLNQLSASVSSYIDVTGKQIPKAYFAQYAARINKLTDFIKLFKPDLHTIDIDKREDGSTYNVNLLFNYGDYVVDQEFESTGIKKLVRIFDSLSNAADGGISFIDELDSNINDVYFSKLIEYMVNYGRGQLCFTTHNVSPMDILQHSRQGIDFLSPDNEIIPWIRNGNYSPRTQYQRGMISKLPFNIDASDFVGILGGD